MYDPEQLRALRVEITQAVRSRDPVAAFDTSPKSVQSRESLIRVAAQTDLLTEAALNRYFAVLWHARDREKFETTVELDVLGHASVRAYWGAAARFRDCDPGLRLHDLIVGYRLSPPNSSSRLRFIQLIFGQSYREGDFGFLEAWITGATDPELASIPNRYVYGVLTGLIRAGRPGLARKVLRRRRPSMSPHDHLFFTVPAWRLSGCPQPVPTTADLVRELHAALPDRGPEWDWFCNAYVQKLSEAGSDFTNLRMQPGQIRELQDHILEALRDRRPLSFQRMGDGSSYRLPLPNCAAAARAHLPADDLSREKSWWRRALPKALGGRFAWQVAHALEGADILGLCSAHRLIRDAVPGQSMVETTTGRALLSHVEALGTRIDLTSKIITEDRAHTLLYDRAYLGTLIAAAKHVTVLGGLSAEQMGLSVDGPSEFIALTPEAHKGLPTAASACSILDGFEDILARVRSASAPGHLLLVSGGYVGKIFVHAAKEQGAVALDIGSRADSLAGFHTRSPADAV